MPMKQHAAGHAVRIGAEAFEKLSEMQELVARRGWGVLGLDTARPATLSAIVEEAIGQLAARAGAR